jgi:hypothetical protein
MPFKPGMAISGTTTSRQSRATRRHLAVGCIADHVHIGLRLEQCPYPSRHSVVVRQKR